MRSNLLFLHFFISAQGLGDYFLGRPNDGFMLFTEEEKELGKNDNFTSTHWFTQKLDHFDPLNTRTFQQRYMSKSIHYKPGGPIFFIFGAEQTLGEWYIWETRQITRNAKKFGAMIYALEHRYYGESRPTPDCSVQNMQYLSSPQALEDAAYFLQTIRAQKWMYNSKIVVFGGSYGVSHDKHVFITFHKSQATPSSRALATWIRLKYPQLVNGAVGSSAPQWATVDFYQFLEVVKNSLDMISPGCSSLVKQAFSAIQSMISQGNLQNVEKIFNTCAPINMTDPLSLMGFYSQLENRFMANVQYNGQSKYSVLPLCEAMKNTSIGEPIHRLASIFEPEKYCFAFDYKYEVNHLSQTSWTADWVKSGTRQWFYQTCTEFGYYQTTDSGNQPFGSTLPLKYYLDVYCRDSYGIPLTTIQNGATQINQMYGGYGLKSNWLIMPNGNIDPWHVLSILQDISPTSIAVFMNGTSHCQDMGTPTSHDSLALIEGRERITAQIETILSQRSDNN